MPVLTRFDHHTGYFADYAIKMVEPSPSCFSAWERIHEIETNEEGRVIRVVVVTVGSTKKWDKNDPNTWFTHKYREYKSRAWITRVLREYAHIAAKRCTPVLL